MKKTIGEWQKFRLVRDYMSLFSPELSTNGANELR